MYDRIGEVLGVNADWLRGIESSMYESKPQKEMRRNRKGNPCIGSQNGTPRQR